MCSLSPLTSPLCAPWTSLLSATEQKNSENSTAESLVLLWILTFVICHRPTQPKTKRTGIHEHSLGIRSQGHHYSGL
jgi:hypothetical protein